MAEVVESHKNEVVIDCSLLSEEERGELEAFVRAQPEVRSVSSPRIDIWASAYHWYLPDTIDHLAKVPWNLVVQFGKAVGAQVAARVLTSRINEFWKERQAKRKSQRQTEARKAKPRRVRQGKATPRKAKLTDAKRRARQNKENYEWVLGSDGRTIKSVRKTED
jgi:hypothetical protein